MLKQKALTQNLIATLCTTSNTLFMNNCNFCAILSYTIKTLLNFTKQRLQLYAASVIIALTITHAGATICNNYKQLLKKQQLA